MSLLEQAKQVKMKRSPSAISQDEISLALAWAREEVSLYQVGTAIGKQGTNLYTWLALCLRASGIAEKNDRR